MSRLFSLSTILSFLSGYVDTAVFVHMKGLFVAHVTGNFVLLGATLTGVSAQHGETTVLQLIAFPVFFLAAASAALAADWIGPAHRTRALLWLATALIGAVGGVGFTPQAPEAVLAILLVVAMGVLNAVNRMDPGLGPPFTVMTGNVTAVAIDMARALRARGADAPAPKSSVSTGTTLLLVSGFALGSAAGAFGQAWLGLGAMIVPALLLGARLARR